ncbi:MAG: dihydropteroate synthase [Zetaproteobacteria bacterium]|nr:MAG: dihydropteroate synthase [Zetaproteobacteria bacterium]
MTRSRWWRKAGSPAWIMGVLNCTPDSFSDGGNYFDVDRAIAHGLAMWEQGAEIIDVGGESTRPGAEPVPVEDELRRVLPVVRALVAHGCRVSVDTMKAEVMARAIEAGACMINDVSALRFDAASLAVVADAGVDVCLMHMQGTPRTMQRAPHYDDVLGEVASFFAQRIDACLAAGMEPSAILLDPGIGFGKRLEDNLCLIANLGYFRSRFEMPVLLGVSRKSFIHALTGAEVHDRELETAVAGGIGVFDGADGLRVHDVALQRRAARVAAALADHRLQPKG